MRLRTSCTARGLRARRADRRGDPPDGPRRRSTAGGFFPVGLIGSGFKAGGVFVEPLVHAVHEIAPAARVAAVEMAPVGGSLLLAARACGRGDALDPAELCAAARRGIGRAPLTRRRARFRATQPTARSRASIGGPRLRSPARRRRPSAPRRRICERRRRAAHPPLLRARRRRPPRRRRRRRGRHADSPSRARPPLRLLRPAAAASSRPQPP